MKSNNGKERSCLIYPGVLILLSAFFLRLGAAAGWDWYLSRRSDPAPFFFGDSDSYWQLGRAIADGSPYEHDPVRHWKIFRMPGYPLFLAPLFTISNDPPVFWGRLENVFLGVLTVFLTGLTARKLLADDRTALLAMLAAAVMPELLFQSVCLLSEELFCVINLLLTLALFRLCRSNFSVTDSILTGFLAALAVYVRPDWFYWLPFAAAAVLLYSHSGRRFFRQNTRQILTASVLIVLVFGLTLSPWWIRNARLTGRFIPTTLQMGASLYDGLSPKADGSSDMSFIEPFRLDVLEHPNGEYWEVQLDQTIKDASLSWVSTHPADAVRLAGVKFQRLWNIVPNEPAFSSLPAKLLIALSFTPILIFAAAGALSLAHKNTLWPILGLAAVYVTLLHIVFVSSLRYRSPILPELIILAAWGFVHSIRTFKVITDRKEI